MSEQSDRPSRQWRPVYRGMLEPPFDAFRRIAYVLPPHSIRIPDEPPPPRMLGSRFYRRCVLLAVAVTAALLLAQAVAWAWAALAG